jgi:hypothetical protein
MSETEKSFTVSDRRHFTPEGRPRAGEADASDAAAPESTEPQAGAARARANLESSSAGDGAPRPARRAELSELLLGLAAQAGALLAGEGLPEGADPSHSLEGGASVISVLEMLRDKTEGRRTPEEDALLEDLLFQLRLAWVEKSRAVGR